MGKTMIPASRHCKAPATIFSTATIDAGSGASTRSSISRVKPNSCTSGRATAWMPWNRIEVATTPATSRVEKTSAPSPVPPTPWPIFGKT
jgi:hypothetical protein